MFVNNASPIPRQFVFFFFYRFSSYTFMPSVVWHNLHALVALWNRVRDKIKIICKSKPQGYLSKHICVKSLYLKTHHVGKKTQNQKKKNNKKKSAEAEPKTTTTYIYMLLRTYAHFFSVLLAVYGFVWLVGWLVQTGIGVKSVPEQIFHKNYINIQMAWNIYDDSFWFI